MQHAKSRNTGVHCEGVKGATADFVCFHCTLVASAEAKSLQHNKSINLKQGELFETFVLSIGISVNREVCADCIPPG